MVEYSLRVQEVPGSNPSRENRKIGFKYKSLSETFGLRVIWGGSLKGPILPPEDLFAVHQTSSFLLNEKRNVSPFTSVAPRA